MKQNKIVKDCISEKNLTTYRTEYKTKAAHMSGFQGYDKVIKLWIYKMKIESPLQNSFPIL